MPSITIHQRDLTTSLVSLIGFGTAAVLEFQGRDQLAQIPVLITVTVTFVLTKLAPKLQPKPGAKRRLIALIVAVLAVLALVFLIERHGRFDDHDYALLWLSCAVLAVWQLVSAALKSRGTA